ncbi:MAG: hypothetical protein PHO02_00700 [Candidatus Nanoarchaeia archaeon]|nr:hypothetical protein [Candidatus Nanoarchaeia archaeon]
MYHYKKCPYCEKELKKIPLKSILCPKCKKRIYVRTLPPKMKKVLIRKNEIRAIEVEWIDYATDSYWFKELEKLGIKKTDFILMYDKLKERFQTAPLIADVMWGVFNNAVIEAIKENNQKKQDSIRVLMDKFKKMESEEKELWVF